MESSAQSSPPPRSLAPKEHGAYGQLALPMLAALGAGRPGLVALLVSASAWALFFAHEPVLVLLGRRGERPRTEHGARARTRIALLGVAGAALGLAGVLLAPMPVRAAVTLPAVLGCAFAVCVALGQERSLVGEALAALALAGVSFPVAIAAGVEAGEAARSWCVWALGFGALLVPVRSIGMRRRATTSLPGRLLPVLLALAAALVLLRAGLGARHLLALAPLLLSAGWFALVPPEPRALPRVGWTVVGAGLLTAALLIAVARSAQPSAGKASAMAAKWQTAATTTSAWKTSWYPNTRGQGSGRRSA